MQNDDEYEYHLTITLPQQKSYSADEILHKVAFAKHPCVADCNQCQELEIFDRVEIPMKRDYSQELPECTQIIKKRLAYMQYLALRLYKLVKKGKFELWSPARDSVVDFSPPDQPNNFFLEQWLQCVHLYPSDLATFFKSERIQLSFDNFDSPQIADYVNGASTSARVGSAIDAIPRKEKLDALAIEIDLILSEFPKLRPSEVCAKLRAKSGSPNSPIVGVITGGLKWERDTGITEEISNKNIGKRVGRWKAKLKNTV